ncbi:MAG TPA: dTMP kinase [Geminicoccaceae bacterium]|nr:dTMP kinase [Geminicoccaceae bacterium]
MTSRGRLITFEGGEGAGKSTQVARLAADLRAARLTVLATREPGGTPGGEAIRSLLVDGPPARWSPLTETLLLLAARHDHVLRVIEPALAAGDWVLCDRFSDSTRVYQGIAGAVGLSLVDQLHRAILGDLEPDLTLILDLPVPVGLARRRASAGENRFERMAEAFHERVRGGFLSIAQAAPERCVVIDAARPEAVVAGGVRAAVHARLGLDLSGAG